MCSRAEFTGSNRTACLHKNPHAQTQRIHACCWLQAAADHHEESSLATLIRTCISWLIAMSREQELICVLLNARGSLFYIPQ
jgi:hypothetical protein